jgi:hypothetical protein
MWTWTKRDERIRLGWPCCYVARTRTQTLAGVNDMRVLTAVQQLRLDDQRQRVLMQAQKYLPMIKGRIGA